MPLLVLLAVLTLYSRSKHKLIRVYHLQLRRPLARLLRGGWRTRVIVSLVGRMLMLLFIAGLGAAVGAVGGEVTRLALQDPGKAKLALGSWTLEVAYVELARTDIP